MLYYKLFASGKMGSDSTTILQTFNSVSFLFLIIPAENVIKAIIKLMGIL